MLLATVLVLAQPQLPDGSFRLFPTRALWTLPLNNTLIATPAFAAGRGYFPIEGDRLTAYDLEKGAQAWTVSAHVQSQPAVGDGMVFVVEPGALSARREADGVEAWRLPFAELLAAPLVWDNGWLVAAASTGSILAFRAVDGHLVWRHEAGVRVHAAPSLAADRVYAPMEDGRILAMRVDTGEPVWERRLGGPPNEVLALDDRLYVGSNDNFFYCLRTIDGTVEWRWRTGADVIGMPLVDEHRVYFVSFDNVLRGLDRKTGAQRWKRALPLRPSRGPVRASDALLISGIAATLPAYSMKDGAPAGDIRAEGELAAAPYVFSTGALPMAALVTRDIAKGAIVSVLMRSIDPAIVPIAPLPNPIVLPKTLPLAAPPTSTP
jgi:outer membrane protein assembly factor BamB